MKKYLVTFLVSFLFCFIGVSIAVFLTRIFMCSLGDANFCEFHKKKYLGIMIPSIVFGIFSVIERFKGRENKLKKSQPKSKKE